MLRVVTGRFHPGLQHALVEDIQRVKADDPLASVAVLVPSSPLVDHLQRVLTVERGLSLLNVRIWTFHQFALRLREEHDPDSDPAAGPTLVDPLFCEQLIRHLVRRGAARYEPFQALGHSSGTWAALWATVRDLKDGLVDAGTALRAIEEGCFDAEEAPWLRALFTLYGAVGEASRALGVGTPDDLAAAQVPRLGRSPLVASLRLVCYYGFYDLTQVQLSLFEAVSRRVPTTLFFPLSDDPREAFARRFFDRYVQPLMASPEHHRRLDESGIAPPPDVAVVSVVGAEEELATACRQILDLVETNGYRWEEIGLVARTLEPYRLHLARVFDRYRIPFRTTAVRPLIHEPLCKTLLLLASLPLSDGYWSTVLDVISSPYFDSPWHHRTPQEIRPDLWRLAVPALRIVRGRAQWARLERCAGLHSGAVAEEDDSLSVSAFPLDRDSTVCLWRIVAPLLEQCDALPRDGSLAQLMAAFRRLMAAHVPRPAAPGADSDADSARSAESVWDAVEAALEAVAALEPITDTLTWAEFVELLTHACERASLPVSATHHGGVLVLDAMAARGLPFKALCLLGMNEQAFPRTIREDAFLRDRHRRVLEATLGFKIDEKLAGYDEEACLFTHLRSAAGRRLIVSYQRADEDGRVLTPSSYLGDAARPAGSGPSAVQAVPRRFSERVAAAPHLLSLLPPADVAQWAILHEQNPDALLEAAGQDTRLYRRAASVLGAIESEGRTLTEFDGLTGPLASPWQRWLDRGISPTALERYAQCPFRAFAADILGLRPSRGSVTHEVQPAVLGRLLHAALRQSYAELVSLGWPARPVADEALTACVARAVGDAAATCEAEDHTGHALLWALAQAEVRRLIAEAVRADERQALEDGFVPVAFEVEGEGELPPLGESGAMPMKVRGRVDRLDRRGESGAVRVIDYKLRLGGSMKADDRDLVRAAVRGARLQPPLYSWLRLPASPLPDEVHFLLLSPRWTPPTARTGFARAVWSMQDGQALRATLGTLFDGLRTGHFAMSPGLYCDQCEFRSICRRTHTPSVWRTAQSEHAQAVRAIRRKDVEQEEDAST